MEHSTTFCLERSLSRNARDEIPVSIVPYNNLMTVAFPDLTTRSFRAYTRWLLAFLLTVVILSAGVWTFFATYQDHFYPGVIVDSVAVEGLSPAEALAILQAQTAPISASTVSLYAEDAVVASSSTDLGLHRTYQAALQDAWAVGRTGSWWHRGREIIASMVSSRHFDSHLAFEQDKVAYFITLLAQKVDQPGTKPSANLRISGAPTSLAVEKGAVGHIVNQPATADLLQASAPAPSSSVAAQLVTVSRELTPEEVTAATARAKKFVGKLAQFTYQEITLRLNDQDLVELLAFPTGASETKLHDLLTKWQQRVERPPQDAEFTYDPATLKVTSFKPHKPGLELDEEHAQATLVQLLEKIELDADRPEATQSSATVEYEERLSVAVTEPQQTLAATNNLGIVERIGFGESEYAHSIPSRIHNVALAASKINNFIIKPGEEFSFNRALGDVSRAAGFQPAYVIKSGQTVLGDGGGVCQVSTTLFRSVLNAGLPITKRKAHSYRVSYYELDSKPGVDATVYSGDVDLRFKNDTGHHILLHTNTDSDNLYMTIELYGTSDGRSAEIIDHKTWDYRSPPASVFIPTDTLPTGRTKQIDWAASGIRASFKNVVKDKDGNLIREDVYTSNYVPWSAKYLRGI